MKQQFRFALLAIATACMITCASCSDKDEPDPVNPPKPAEPEKVSVKVSVTLPDDITTVSDEKYTFNNITTQQSESFTDAASISLLPGLYDLSYTATASLHDGIDAEVRASRRSITVKEGTSVALEAFVNLATDDLIIEEIYFAGSLTGSAYQYSADNYVKLYNNTDHVIYADGIAIFETTFMSVQKFEYSPDIRDEAVAVDAVYVVPGSGKDCPVEPGKSLLIADNGMNHLYHR